MYIYNKTKAFEKVTSYHVVYDTGVKAWTLKIIEAYSTQVVFLLPGLKIFFSPKGKKPNFGTGVPFQGQFRYIIFFKKKHPLKDTGYCRVVVLTIFGHRRPCLATN